MYALMILNLLGFLCVELLRVVSEVAITSLRDINKRDVVRGKSRVIAVETAGSLRVMKGVHFINTKVESWEL
jgi:hypothetical protein